MVSAPDWVNSFDLRLSQELPGFFKDHKSELWLDIQNVGNLLNKEWGHVVWDYGFNANSSAWQRSPVVHPPGSSYVYNYRFAGTEFEPSPTATGRPDRCRRPDQRHLAVVAAGGLPLQVLSVL
jgi:hypothetical protein